MANGEEIGSTVGSVGGGAVGTAFGGPLGGVVGSQVGAFAGGAIGGLFDRDGGAEVARVDQNQIARLREIDRTRKQISEGTDPLTQNAISDIKQTGETVKGQLAKFTGGDVGGTISSFLRAQRNTGKAINNRFSQSQARSPFFENLSVQLGNRVAQRKLELDINTQDTQRAQQAQAQTNQNLNLSGLLASSFGNGGLNSVSGNEVDESNAFASSLGGTFDDGLGSRGTAPTIAAEGFAGGIGGGGAFSEGISGGGAGQGFGGFGF